LKGVYPFLPIGGILGVITKFIPSLSFGLGLKWVRGFRIGPQVSRKERFLEEGFLWRDFKTGVHPHVNWGGQLFTS